MINMNLWGRRSQGASVAEPSVRSLRGMKTALVGAAIAVAATIATAIPAAAQIVTIQQVSNGRYLDAWEDAGHDYQTVVWSQQNNDTQLWRMTNVEGQVYTFQQVSSDRYMDAHENSENDYNVVTRPAQNNNTQRWLVTDLGGGIHNIQQVSSGRYLDAHESSEQGWRNVTRPWQGNATQQWRITIVSYEFNPVIIVPDFEILVPGSSAPPPPPAVYSSGTFELGGPMSANLDNGTIAFGPGDFQYAAPDLINLQFIPQSGGQLSYTTGAQRGYAGCNAAAFSGNAIALSSVSAGDYICAKTSEGRISEFRIDSIGPIISILTISYTTWQ